VDKLPARAAPLALGVIARHFRFMAAGEDSNAGRLIAIELDDASILRRNDDIERERKVAMYDLLEANSFIPCRSAARGAHGPYRLALSVREGRLTMAVSDERGGALETVVLGLASFQRTIRDYFAICESYYRAIAQGGAAGVETVDMARRAIHDEAADRLVTRLDGKIALDHATARRLFTLISVLHIR